MGPLAKPPLGIPTTRRFSIRLVLTLASVLCAVVLVSGCGDDDDAPSGTPTATSGQTAAPTATARPSPAPTEADEAGDEFSTDNAMAHLQHLAVDIGVRAAGTDGEREAAEYIRDELASYGYDVSLQEFPIQIYEGVNVTLDVDGHPALAIRPNILSGTASGDVSGRIVAAGIGRPEDFPSDTSGAIALIERGDLAFIEKAANAEAAGAIGVVVYNNGPGPFEGTLGQGAPTNLPVVALPREDGLALLDVLGDGVTGRLTVQIVASDATSQNVVARAPGGDCRVIAGGHYDSVAAGPGANDNGSGTATAMEVARVMAARGEMGHTCFVLFGSEEIGLVGSAYYASQLSQDESDAIIGVLNFDMFGVGTDWSFIGTDDMTQLAGETASALGIPYRISSEPPNVGSDHASFINFGISAMLFNCFCDPNYHTAADRYEFILPDRLLQAGEIGLGMAEAMLSQASG